MAGAAQAHDAVLDSTLRALADPTRRSILRLVHGRERSAGEIADRFPHMSRPAVSQHLRVLTDARLVVVRPDGNRRCYRASTENLAEAWAFLDEMWRDRLAGLKDAAEHEAEQGRPMKRRPRRKQ